MSPQPDVRTLADGRTIVAECRSGGCIQAGGSLGTLLVAHAAPVMIDFIIHSTSSRVPTSSLREKFPTGLLTCFSCIL